MILEEFRELKANNGVIKLSDVDESFEKLYLEVRKKEKRIYSDDELKLLPYASKLNILDIGCGNGWFVGQLSKEFEHNYFCVDINLTELEQAARVFVNENIKLIYADIFTTSFPSNTFYMVIINSALQYFQNVQALFKELFFISKTYGEVHIFDTPFYNENEIMMARNRTLKHYSSVGYPAMAARYFHHTTDELKNFRLRYLYNPNSFKNKLAGFIFDPDSPFPWIV